MSDVHTLVIEIRTNEDPNEVILGLMRLLAWQGHIVNGGVAIPDKVGDGLE